MKTSIRCLFIVMMIFASAMKTIAAEKGDEAISTALPLLENRKPGKSTSLKNYRGKLVYLDFWASWCGPCRKSLPILNELRNQYASQGFEVIAINVDEKLSDALQFLDKYPVDYPILLDPKGSQPQAYKVQGMPTAYLIDEKGNIIYKHKGFKKKDRQKIENLIQQHFANR